MKPSTHGSEDAPSSATALLITDMISLWDFPNARALRTAARRIADPIARLKHRFRAAQAPIVYANDNRGRWRSDLRQLVELSLDAGRHAAEITTLLAPEVDDYFVLKPKHSAFLATPLEILLAHLHVRRLVITGVAADQCVLMSAADARMRNLEVMIPRDCVGAETRPRTRAAVLYFERVLQVATPESARVRI